MDTKEGNNGRITDLEEELKRLKEKLAERKPQIDDLEVFHSQQSTQQTESRFLAWFELVLGHFEIARVHGRLDGELSVL